MNTRRRANLISGGEEYVLYPDHFCVKFKGTSLNNGYYFGPSCISSLIIDGVVIPSNQFSNYCKDGSNSSFYNLSDGEHVIYFKTVGNLASNRRPDVRGTYFRFPVDAVSQLGQAAPRTYISGKVLDSLSETPPALFWSDFGVQNSTSNPCNSLTKIRVPIGCGAAYKAASVWKQKKNIIVEYDFKLDPNYNQELE